MIRNNFFDKFMSWKVTNLYKIFLIPFKPKKINNMIDFKAKSCLKNDIFARVFPSFGTQVWEFEQINGFM